MKILITGATGLIGREIIKLCLDKKYEVHYLTTNKNKIGSIQGCTGFYWNPKDQEIDMQSFTDVDAIINLAGAHIAKRWTSAYKEEILHSRTSALQLLDKALQQEENHHINSMVTASAIGIYPSSYTHYYEEEADVETSSSFLGNVVKQWETAADQLKKYNIPIAKIRIGIVLSDRGGALVPIARSINYYMGSAIGDGTHWQSWIHCKDIAALFLFAVEHRLAGIYNGVAPNPVIYSKFIKEIASIIKKPLFLPAIPKKVLKIIFGDMAQILYSSQRVSAKKTQNKGFKFEFKNVDKALENLL